MAKTVKRIGCFGNEEKAKEKGWTEAHPKFEMALFNPLSTRSC
jgi:hypothetical protein